MGEAAKEKGQSLLKEQEILGGAGKGLKVTGKDMTENERKQIRGSNAIESFKKSREGLSDGYRGTLRASRRL